MDILNNYILETLRQSKPKVQLVNKHYLKTHIAAFGKK